MSDIRADHWTDDQLRKTAEGYLAKVHPTGELPIPIEDIIDIHEKIDIVPVQGLRDLGHDGYAAKDRKTIYVDRQIYESSNPHRFRFTLAHELAHILLHKQVFEAADFDCIDGWKAFLSSIPDEALRWIERQAGMFAGFLLVPTEHLSREYAVAAETLEARGIDIRTMPPKSLLIVAKSLGTKFRVSSSVIHRRAVKEGLWEWDDLPEN